MRDVVSAVLVIVVGASVAIERVNCLVMMGWSLAVEVDNLKAPTASARHATPFAAMMRVICCCGW